LNKNFNGEVPALGYGSATSSCYLNLKLLFCNLACSPTQSLFNLTANSQNQILVVVGIQPETVQALYDSCENRCFASANKTVGDHFNGNLQAFLNSLSSAEDPDFKYSISNPQYAFTLQSNGGLNLTSSFINATANDTLGCSVVNNNTFSASNSTGSCLDGTTPAVRTLDFCPQWGAPLASCCTPAEEILLESEVSVTFPAVGLGNGSCYENLKNLFCAFTCAGNQSSFGTVNALSGGILNYTITLAKTYVQQLYASCKDECLTLGGGTLTVALETGGDLPTFVALFDSANAPGYKPDSTHPYVWFVIANSGFSTSVLAATAADQVGCQTQQVSDGSLMTYPLCLLVMLLASLLL